MKKGSAGKFRIILHPFLIASFASLSLLANNLTEIGLAGMRAWILSVVAALLIFTILRIVIKDSLKAGLGASGAILLIFSYGHVLDFLQTLLPKLSLTRGSILTLFIWLALFAFWIFVLTRKLHNLAPISNYLNIVALILNILPVYDIATFSSQIDDIASLAQEFIAQNRLSVDEIGGEFGGVAGGEEPRDIYFIILDAYTRADVLEELYGYDNSEFIEFLQSRGFLVDQIARTNYIQSEYSIASSLNMMHINALPEFLRQNNFPDDQDSIRLIAQELLRNNLSKQVLEDQGYQTVTFDNGFGATMVRDVDHFVSSPEIEGGNLWQLGFEFMLLDTTLGREFINILGEERSPHRKLFDAHREMVLYTLANLSNFADKEGSYFIYSHILAPHVPYVFGPNGEEIRGHDTYTLLDAQPGNEANIQLYRDQVQYLNTLVMDTIDQILQNSPRTPIIILQADHGSKVFNDVEPPTSVKMDLLLPILSAVLLPEVGDDVIHFGSSPVNNFRKILNLYAGTSLPMLENTSFVLEVQNGRTQFIDACDKSGTCSQP